MNLTRISHVLTKAIAGIAENDLRAMQEAKGSYFELGKKPKDGAMVWALVGQINPQPRKGVIRRTEQTYHGNHYYCDFESDGRIFRVASDALFDHKPKKVQRKDQFGSTTVWE